MAIIEFNKKRTAALQKTINGLRIDFKTLKFDMQGFVDALTGEESASSYGNNNYRQYAGAIKAVNDKYENLSAWGNGLTANIIDFRAAVTVSSGPQFKPAMESTLQQRDEKGKTMGGEDNTDENTQDQEDAADEMDFCRSFFEANDINHETPQEWGREAEIEGRCAVVLEFDDIKKQVITKHIPWSVYKYKEIRSKTNKKEIEKITWQANVAAGIEAGEAEKDKLVCRRFSGRNSAAHPTTKIMRVITQIEQVDQAFRDWREINRLYATPVPVFECKTEEEAEAMKDAIKAGLNFKIKKAWAVVGTFKFTGPEMTGIDSLEKEIMRLSCFIAGTTGYPLQFLLPDMLSNRSTSENIMESALIHTASERAIWTGFYEELITKAMKLNAVGTGKTALDPNKIAITISLMTEEQWQRLIQFWLPAFKDDLITREAALSQIPDFNLREELDRRDEADKSQVAQISAELEQARLDAADANKNNQFGNKGGGNDNE